MILSGTYADLDRFAILSQSFTLKDLPNAKTRRRFFKEFNDLCEYMESLSITKEFDELANRIDSFHKSNTTENEKDPERIAEQKILNEQINGLNAKKSHVPIFFEGFSKESWGVFKGSYEAAASNIPQYSSAKSLSVIDEWVEMVDENNKK